MKNFSSICFSSPVFWLFALAVVFLGDLLFFGKIFLSRDMLSGFFQTAVFETQGLLNGDTPFWNPYWGGGKPLIADTTSQAFYPPNILFLFFQPALAMNLFWLLHFFIGGLGMWFFCRQINVAAAAAFIAGVSFMFGTWLVAQLEFPFNGAAGVWVPWIFGMLARFHARLAADGGYPPGEIWRQRRLVGALALLFAVQFFANFPEMIIYPGVGYALYIIAAVISERKWRTGVTLLLFVGVSGLVGLLMTLPQIVSMWELLPYSERAGTFDSRFDMASMQPAHLLGVIFPFLGGFPGWPDKHWESGLFEYWIGAFYLGALPVVSAPFAFLDLSGRRKIWAWVATAMILIGVLLSLGAHTPLYGWWHAHVPLMNRFRFPAKFLVLVVLGLLVLAALGIDTLLRRPSVTDKKKQDADDGFGRGGHGRRFVRRRLVDEAGLRGGFAGQCASKNPGRNISPRGPARIGGVGFSGSGIRVDASGAQVSFPDFATGGRRRATGVCQSAGGFAAVASRRRWRRNRRAHAGPARASGRCALPRLLALLRSAAISLCRPTPRDLPLGATGG